MIPTEALCKLHKRQRNVRNICILAHVDHGKTTLADTLVASNGVISEKSAGSVRYMDNREDEQARLITMKSSAISLAYKEKNPRKINPETGPLFLINLIDSPGHVDFTSEVSTAVRVSDGAVVVVDVVDGVGVQTKTVIRQMWKENLLPILVLNKVDRLFSHLKMTPIQAFLHLNKLLEQINVILASFFKEDAFSKAQQQNAPNILDNSNVENPSPSSPSSSSDANTNQVSTEDWLVDIKDDQMERYFSPQRDNVVFASAADRWGFRLSDFARTYADRLGIKPLLLRRALWDNHYLKAVRLDSGETVNRVVSKPPGPKSLPLFVELVLKPIWDVYRNAISAFNPKRLQTIVQTLSVQVLPRDLLPDADHRNLLRSILSQWLPLSTAVLGAVVDHLPDPITAQARRVPHLFRPLSADLAIPEDLAASHAALQDAMLRCDAEYPQTVVFIAKVFDAGEKPVYHRNPSTPSSSSNSSSSTITITNEGDDDNDNDDEKNTTSSSSSMNKNNFVAFARIFCGTLRPGAELMVLGPKYNPQLSLERHCTRFTVEHLYMLMGRDVAGIPEIPAGNVFGIGGIEEHVLKTATLSTTPLCTTFSEMPLLTAPLVRVAIEPENLLEKPQFVKGLRLLNQSDPCVDVLLQANGEYVLVAAGEVHLQRCLHDLRQSFCPGIRLRVSAPIVGFRETIVKAKARGATSLQAAVRTADKRVELEVVAELLPEAIQQCLAAHQQAIKQLSMTKRQPHTASFSAFFSELQQAFFASGKRWRERFEKIWAFGPRRVGSNLLLNDVPGFQHASPWTHLPSDAKPPNDAASTSQPGTSGAQAEDASLAHIAHSLCNGFELSTTSGPICEEQMVGVCFILSRVSFQHEAGEINAASEEGRPSSPSLGENDSSLPASGQATEASASSAHYFGPLTGQVVSAMSDACRKAFMNHSVRLVEPVYSGFVEVVEDQLGLVFGCLARRRAQIISDNMREGSNVFEIEVILPVAESFGFADELLTQARGAASVPSLIFSGWKILPDDPFFIPETEEELEEFGSNYRYLKNTAADLIQMVRKRKGLSTNEKLVESGEKQRNLARKK